MAQQLVSTPCLTPCFRNCRRLIMKVHAVNKRFCRYPKLTLSFDDLFVVVVSEITRRGAGRG